MRNEEPANIKSTETDTTLDALRAEIDDIDLKIATLLDRRLGVSLEIGKRKQLSGVGVHDGKREQIVLDRVRSQGRDESTADFIRDVYDRILQGSRAVQSKLSQK